MMEADGSSETLVSKGHGATSQKPVILILTAVRNSDLTQIESALEGGAGKNIRPRREEMLGGWRKLHNEDLHIKMYEIEWACSNHGEVGRCT
jgi:hypothetical protein